MGDKARLPGPGPLFGLTAHAAEREAMWREREERRERKMKAKSQRERSRELRPRPQRTFVDTMSSRKAASDLDTFESERDPTSFSSRRVPGAPVNP